MWGHGPNVCLEANLLQRQKGNRESSLIFLFTNCALEREGSPPEVTAPWRHSWDQSQVCYLPGGRSSPPNSCCNDQPCAQPLPSRPHHSQGAGPTTWQASWAFGALPRGTLNPPNSAFCAAEPCWLLMLCKEPSVRVRNACSA